MIEAIWIVSIVLAAVAATDRRARPLLYVVALGTVQMVFAEIMTTDRLSEIAIKAPIDLSCGLLACYLVTKERWTLMVPALLCVSLIAHGAYWLARFNEIDIWGIYAHTLNVLFLGQLVALCWPAGGNLIGTLASWARGVFAVQRRLFGPVYEKAISRRNHTSPHDGSNCDLHLSKAKRT